MKRIFIGLAAILVATPAAADVWVNPHVRKDGTYVPGHWRSSPNSTPFDNYSTQGNVNPYNGKRGTTDPFSLPRLPSFPPPSPPVYQNTMPVTPYYTPTPIAPLTPYSPPRSSYQQRQSGSSYTPYCLDC